MKELTAQHPIAPTVRGLLTSPTLAIQEECAALASQGRRVHRLGLGQSPFPVPVPVVEGLKANATRKDYLPVRGLHALREAVAQYHRRRHDVPCTADDVLVAPGSKELMFLLQVAYDGELLLPTPAWVSYAPQAAIVGRTVALLPTSAGGGWRLAPDHLDSWCARAPARPRVVVLNYPSNPTGTTYSDGELLELARVARKHGLLVLSDEIYGELEFDGHHRSIARHYPEGTIVASGLSKWCGAGGWRLGTFVFPTSYRWLLDAMATIASETYTSTSAPIQHAAVRAFQGGMEIERYLAGARRILSALTARCASELRDAGARVVSPRGAFYLFPDLTPSSNLPARRDVRTSDALCRRLLAELGVAALPGSVFGRPPTELTLRIATVDFDGAKALAALESMGPSAPVDDAFLNAHCWPVLAAVSSVARWLREP